MASKRRQTLYSNTSFRLLLVFTVVAVFIYSGKAFFSNLGYSRVLGASTFIADQGQPNQDGPDGNPGQFNQPENPNQGQPPAGQNALGRDGSNPGVDMGSLNKIEFQSENGRSQVNLENGNSSIEIGSEGGKLNIKARNENGTEIQLQDNSLNKINEALQNQDMEISTTSGNGFLLRKGQFEAQTHFPISINPTTNAMTITTPAGVKTVTVLPDQAVNNLLQRRLINSVASSSASTGIILGVLNNTPAFQISGIDNKKLLGLIPVSIDKTAIVSAQDGSILQLNESFLSKLLDFLSVQ